MDMNNESKEKALVPEGLRPFKIVACVPGVSKTSGNDMFTFTFMDLETKIDIEVYAVAVKGKRWFLKNILAVCGVAAHEDGVYDWEISDVMEKIVNAYVEHEPNEWVNNKGIPIKTTRAKISDVEEATLEDIKKYSEEIPF